MRPFVLLAVILPLLTLSTARGSSAQDSRADTVLAVVFPDGNPWICETRTIAEDILAAQRSDIVLRQTVLSYKQITRNDSLLIAAMRQQAGVCQDQVSNLRLQNGSLARERDATGVQAQSYQALWRKERRRRRALTAGLTVAVAFSIYVSVR